MANHQILVECMSSNKMGQKGDLAKRHFSFIAYCNYTLAGCILYLGLTFEDIEALDDGRQLGAVTALLLADNGYAPLNPPLWLANLRPEVVLLSVAAGDFDGLPSPETLAALEGYTILRTDQHVWIEITTDGRQMWLEVERE